MAKQTDAFRDLCSLTNRSATSLPQVEYEEVAPDDSSGIDPGKAPPNWEEMYARIEAMRAPGGIAADAAVDSLGCEKLWDVDSDPATQRFQVLVSLMLSSQTKDEVTAAAVRRLQGELPGTAKCCCLSMVVFSAHPISSASTNLAIGRWSDRRRCPCRHRGRGACLHYKGTLASGMRWSGIARVPVLRYPPRFTPR